MIISSDKIVSCMRMKCRNTFYQKGEEKNKQHKLSKFGDEAIKFNEVTLEANEWSESKWTDDVELI